MTASLYQATVPSFLQVLTAVGGLIEKARAHCAEQGLPDEALTEARIAPDMWPFAKQVMTACQHSAGAVAGVQQGEIKPDLTPLPTSFAGLAAQVAEALAQLKAVTPEQIDGIGGNDTFFRFGDRRMDFTVEDYLLSFALPNFHFHAAMAYAVLRGQGLALGKRDFIGTTRHKG